MLNSMDMISKKWAIVPFAFIQVVALSINYYIVPQFKVYKLCHNTFSKAVCNHLENLKFKKEENYILKKQP